MLLKYKNKNSVVANLSLPQCPPSRPLWHDLGNGGVVSAFKLPTMRHLQLQSCHFLRIHGPTIASGTRSHCRVVIAGAYIPSRCCHFWVQIRIPFAFNLRFLCLSITIHCAHFLVRSPLLQSPILHVCHKFFGWGLRAWGGGVAWRLIRLFSVLILHKSGLFCAPFNWFWAAAIMAVIIFGGWGFRHIACLVFLCACMIFCINCGMLYCVNHLVCVIGFRGFPTTFLPQFTILEFDQFGYLGFGFCLRGFWFCWFSMGHGYSRGL